MAAPYVGHTIRDSWFRKLRMKSWGPILKRLICFFFGAVFDLSCMGPYCEPVNVTVVRCLGA